MMSSLVKVIQVRQYNLLSCNHILLTRCYSKHDSSSSSSDEDDKKPKKQKTTTETPQPQLNTKAVNRLNELLKSMSTDNYNILSNKKIELPKVGNKKLKIKSEREKIKQEANKATNSVVDAAKDVAQLLGGDVKQTESELLSKLLIHSEVKDMAGEVSQVEKELSLNDLIVGMKIDKNKPSDSETKSEFVRRNLRRSSIVSSRYENRDGRKHTDRYQQRRTPPINTSGSVNLFGSEPLGIFKDPSKLQESPDILDTWSLYKQRELKLAITHPPGNYFEKMIKWTEQGKIWKFPIDNEQGLEQEQSVYFAEHVFLEKHLEPWCSTKGPIRHFMELVCVGLSKNPYITIEDKQDHINWFKEYFEGKKELLESVIKEDKPVEKVISS